MAIAETGNAETGATSGTAAEITHGLTINEGDIIIVTFSIEGTGNNFTDNNGVYSFTEEIQEAPGGQSSIYGIVSRIAGANEPSTYKWTLDASNDWSILLRVFSGVDTGDIWDVSPAEATRTSGIGTTATSLDMTTSTNGAMGILYVVTDGNITYSNPTNNYANELEKTTGWSQASYTHIWSTASTVGTAQVTLSASNDWTIHHIALKPDAVAGTNTQINIGDAWKEVGNIFINIGDAWKDVTSAKINIGDSWKTIF